MVNDVRAKLEAGSEGERSMVELKKSQSADPFLIRILVEREFEKKRCTRFKKEFD